MGVEPFVHANRKQSLAPIQSAPRTSVTSVLTSHGYQQGRRGSTKGSKTIAKEQRPPSEGGRSTTLDEWASDSAASADAVSATLAGVAAHVKNAIKAYEQITSLPYEDVPMELCRPVPGTRSIDLSAWSLLVNDTALRSIARVDSERIDNLARESIANKVGGHIKAMGLASASKGVDAVGVPRFDATSMVAWREKQTLRRMNEEEFTHAQEHFTSTEGLTSLDIAGSEELGDGGVAALTAQCCRLRSLNMSGAHRITDVAIRSLAVNCTGLARLNLSGCLSIMGPGLAVVGECCPKLVDLDISGCKQIGHWVLTRLFRGCHELETVSLARCSRVGDEELKELGVGCRRLTKLDLRDCNQVSDTGLLEIARRCSALTVLNLSRSELPFKVGDVTLLALGEGCPRLQRLIMTGCDSVTDVGLAWMSDGCPALTYLDISGCIKVSNAGVTSLCESCPLLSHLAMARAKLVTDVGIARLGAGCPSLTHLDMSGLVNISDGMQRDFAVMGIQALAQGCTGLQTLILDRCFQVSKIALRAVGVDLHCLRQLSLAYCPAIALDGMVAVAKGCPHLTDLNLTNCGSVVTDAMVAAFAKGCPYLRRLKLRGIVGVPPPLGAPGVLAICYHCRELTFLDLGEVWGLEDSALVGFHEHQMEKLEQVNLMNCPNITGAGVQWLAEGCPALSSLNVKGTKATLTALNIVKERYPYTRIKVDAKFFGLAPLRRLKGRLAIKRHAALHGGARKIQGCFRAKKAREEVCARRLVRAEEKAARMVNRIWRMKQGRAKLQALRLIRDRNAIKAVVIQKLWRKAIARMLAEHRRRERDERKRARQVTSIQRTYRGVRGRRKACKQQVEVVELRRRRVAAAMMMQQRFRIHRAQGERVRLYDAAKRLEIKRDKAAEVMQSRWRSHRARQKLERMKRLLLEEKRRRNTAATSLQSMMRASSCRRAIRRMVEERACKNVNATVIQRHYRGACARENFVVLRAERQVEREKRAALSLQCWFRLTTSKALLGVLIMTKHLRYIRELKAAKTIQQSYRRYRIRLEAAAAKLNHEDDVREMSRLEDWAATRIQALARGAAGRSSAVTRRREHMARWKEMYDEGRGANFYYNKVSGEIRWRRPQDFLDLLPRPSCGDCGVFEAFVECADCGEFFCSSCFRNVHGGGKRLRHEFRALYDYYGKRVDYGEGEYPSCWPTDMAQDDANGWRLRVSPERIAAEEKGDWARYTANEDDAHLGEDLYFNNTTGESGYQPPPEWEWLEATAAQALGTSTYEEDSGNTDWSYGVSAITTGEFGAESSEVMTGQLSASSGWPWQTHWDEAANRNYYLNMETGESTYEEPPGLSEQVIGYEDFEGHGTVPFTAGGEWTKYYDPEYAADYYHNSRTLQTQYDRPEGFYSPRGDCKALGGHGWGG